MLANTASSDRMLCIFLNRCFAVSIVAIKEPIIVREADMALVYKTTFYIILIYLIKIQSASGSFIKLNKHFLTNHMFIVKRELISR